LEIRLGHVADIAGVMQLHAKYHIDSISELDKSDGFITTQFSVQELNRLIAEDGLFVAVDDGSIVAYVMAASWHYWASWPIFAHMITELPTLEYEGIPLNCDNSYQYGPVCVDRSYRSSGLFEAIFNFALRTLSARYPVLIPFINQLNPRSLEAHVRKAGLQITHEFSFNNNRYFELACLTQRPLSDLNYPRS